MIIIVGILLIVIATIILVSAYRPEVIRGQSRAGARKWQC